MDRDKDTDMDTDMDTDSDTDPNRHTLIEPRHAVFHTKPSTVSRLMPAKIDLLSESL
jgi:hypothetical protein